MMNIGDGNILQLFKPDKYTKKDIKYFLCMINYDPTKELLEKGHVAVTAGEAFDAPGFVRISYATSMDLLKQGAARILEFAESYGAKETSNKTS